MPYDDVLFRRLRESERADLVELLGCLKLKPEDFAGATDEDLVQRISKELRSVAGNSFRNLARGEHDLPYRTILVGVADKLTQGLRGSRFKKKGEEPEEEIENEIYDLVLKKIQSRAAEMTPEQAQKAQEQIEAYMKKRGYPAAATQSVLATMATGGGVGALAATPLAAVMFGGLWTWLFGFSLGQLLVGGLIAGGPVGIAVGGIIAISGPSYSKTIPSIVRIVSARKSREALAPKTVEEDAVS